MFLHLFPRSKLKYCNTFFSSLDDNLSGEVPRRFANRRRGDAGDASVRGSVAETPSGRVRAALQHRVLRRPVRGQSRITSV